MPYFVEDAIEQVKKLRQTIEECKQLCKQDQNATPLQKKIVETLELLSIPVEDLLQINYRFNDLDL